jgi:hypothetical protein
LWHYNFNQIGNKKDGFNYLQDRTLMESLIKSHHVSNQEKKKTISNTLKWSLEHHSFLIQINFMSNIIMIWNNKISSMFIDYLEKTKICLKRWFEDNSNRDWGRKEHKWNNININIQMMNQNLIQSQNQINNKDKCKEIDNLQAMMELLLM